ncbi:MAG: 5-methyltetrahydropteroyltriglutamate--homocysteine S-methyltransferase [Candidatus Omnitrophota bacterium]|nr:MAG: 5-methyltetrahydropteroyltriglutamate--homocysteine S-methyltransferase [Candidatus Omnitrophota bacterium]
MHTYAYGFPRLGKNKEFKKHIEDFWEKKITEKELISLLNEVEKERISYYKSHVDTFPLGEFTYYDNIFDTALIFGIYRFKNFDEYFAYARGRYALELKKYFNTNYHYLVPSVSSKAKFRLRWNKPLFYFNTFFSFRGNPLFLVGPYTFLKLSRVKENFDKAFVELCRAYKELFVELEKQNVDSLHIEEPAFCLNLPQKEIDLIVKNYKKMLTPKLNVNLMTYYESVDFLDALYELPVYGLGLDFIAGEQNIKILRKKGFPKDKKLICGIIDGRSVQRAHILHKAQFLDSIKKAAKIKETNIILANSCPLYHLPVTLEGETSTESYIKRRMSFAKEKLYELHLLKEVVAGRGDEATTWSKAVNKTIVHSQPGTFDTLSIKEREFLKRKNLQQKNLRLPFFPTTTIGSFPQDKELRKARLAYRKGRLSIGDYDRFIRDKITKLIGVEEDIGLDVLVHGEFERTDMVEFFAQKLNGFLTTENGWIISYGTRVYRPPIIYARIKRDAALTVKEIYYAQSITPKPMKGIFTGPITILAWSYNLRNEPLHEIAFELARALNQEAKELIKKDIKIIQIDEPAMKEFAPLKKEKRDSYFRWAVRAFNLTSQLAPTTQIHTHMCYSDFEGIIKWILKMNFDVITIETAREQAKILDAFKGVKFHRAIGPGVWDIHSQCPAQEKTIRRILNKSIKIFGARNVWVNPDCGLKTRKMPEVETSLKRIVKVANTYRKKFKKSK